MQKGIIFFCQYHITGRHFCCCLASQGEWIKLREVGKHEKQKIDQSDGFFIFSEKFFLFLQMTPLGRLMIVPLTFLKFLSVLFQRHWQKKARKRSQVGTQYIEANCRNQYDFLSCFYPCVPRNRQIERRWLFTRPFLQV